MFIGNNKSEHVKALRKLELGTSSESDKLDLAT
jgi:hypothetical protein